MSGDPLAELLTLHPLTPPHPHAALHPLEAEAAAARGSSGGAAWRASHGEARQLVRRLMALRSERLAVLESRPPMVHWLVLTSTGTSLVLGFAIVCIATRPAHALVSRTLFAALTGALLSVARLLLDLAEPFDGRGYTIAAESAAGAYLAPTRRRLVAALTRPRPRTSKKAHLRGAA